jgi:hypothetical protein
MRLQCLIDIHAKRADQHGPPGFAFDSEWKRRAAKGEKARMPDEEAIGPFIGAMLLHHGCSCIAK